MKIFEEYEEREGQIILDSFEHPDGTKFYWLIDEAIGKIAFATKSKAGIQGFKDFLSKHPYMTGMAVGVGLNAIDSYRTNKRLTTRFFANNQIERDLYRNVARDLVKTGKYTMIKNGKRIKNGWLWELKRKGLY